ncbi:MAG: type II toxin-antitoxin system VapC family toxin [Coriobacteriia bacterium]
MNVVDSSAWLEYFGDGPNASEFSGAIEAPDEMVVPSLTLFEVFKRTCQLKGEATALEAMGVMLQGRVVELSVTLSIDAARLSLGTGLAMADAIILATARAEEAVLWTQDAHFEGLANVEYREMAG